MPTGKGPGRPKKYPSASTLANGVNGYFESITRKDKYVRAPSVAGLCLKLGISRSTWYGYADDDALAPVVEQARLLMEDYWTNQLAGKFANGAKFALGSGFGWLGKGRWNEKPDEGEREESEGGVIEITGVTEDG